MSDHDMNPVYDKSGNRIAVGDVVTWDDEDRMAVVTAVLSNGELRADIYDPASDDYSPEWLNGTIHKPDCVTRMEDERAFAVIREWLY